jgi:hypothetical protein
VVIGNDVPRSPISVAGCAQAIDEFVLAQSQDHGSARNSKIVRFYRRDGTFAAFLVLKICVLKLCGAAGLGSHRGAANRRPLRLRLTSRW